MLMLNVPTALKMMSSKFQDVFTSPMNDLYWMKLQDIFITTTMFVDNLLWIINPLSKSLDDVNLILMKISVILPLFFLMRLPENLILEWMKHPGATPQQKIKIIHLDKPIYRDINEANVCVNDCLNLSNLNEYILKIKLACNFYW